MPDAAILDVGGISRPAAWISGVIFAVAFSLALLGIVPALVHDDSVPNRFPVGR